MDDKKRQLFRPRAAASIVIANMVGTGVFTSLGFQLADIQSGFVLMMLWAIGGVIAFCGAMSYAELGAALPRSGGEYNFLGEIYHPAAGFVSGWVSATVGFAGPTALAAITFATYLGSAFPAVPQTPAAVALVAIPGLIVGVLFERGAFTSADTQATALALAIYALGLPSFVLQKVLQPAYFAREDTRTPLRFAIVSMIVNVALAIGLAPVAGFLAAAIGTTLAGWANTALLWRGVRKLDPDLTIDNRLANRLPRIVIASAIMGVAAWAMTNGLQAVIPGQTIAILALVLPASIVLYFALAIGLGAFLPSDLKQALRRGRDA